MGSIYQNDDSRIQRDNPGHPSVSALTQTACSRGNGFYSAGTRFAGSWSAAFTPFLKPLN